MSQQKRKTTTRKTTSSASATATDEVTTATTAADHAATLKVDLNVLISTAKRMRKLAYAPYSHYAVGAALVGLSGQVYGGCNVENGAYGVTICAEATALVKAISSGERKFDAIVVVTEDGASPCGKCRQMLSEFDPDLAVIIADTRGRYRITTVADLLPLAFNFERGRNAK
jgi:cytidine deaminase